MLFNGDGIPIIKEKAAEYFKKASNQGDDEAMQLLGSMHLEGDGISMNKNKE